MKYVVRIDHKIQGSAVGKDELIDLIGEIESKMTDGPIRIEIDISEEEAPMFQYYETHSGYSVGDKIHIKRGMVDVKVPITKIHTLRSCKQVFITCGQFLTSVCDPSNKGKVN